MVHNRVWGLVRYCLATVIVEVGLRFIFCLLRLLTGVGPAAKARQT
jgi:hypothetical protein